MSSFKINFDFKDIEKNVLKEVDKELIVTANLVATEAKKTVAFKTGFLQTSIGVDIRNKEVAVQALANYAGFVEFGTTKQRAQPFLYPAYFKETKGLLKRITKIVENEATK